MAAVIYEIKPQLDRFNREMRTAGRTTRDTSRQMNKLDRSTDKTTRSTKGLTTAMRGLRGIFLTLGAGLALRAFVNIGKEFEILTARLATFQGSIKLAEESLNRLNIVAQSTPFQLQDVINSFIQLRSAGLTPTNKELTALGNVAAAFGQTMNQVANVVFRGAASTELFYNLGITARKEGDKLRVTYDGVTQTIEATNKGIQEYLVLLGNTRFAGAALEQAKGLTAAFSNLSGNLQFLINELGKSTGAFDRISIVMNSISTDLIRLTGLTQDADFGFDPDAFRYKVGDIRLQIAKFADDVTTFFSDKDNVIATSVIGGLLSKKLTALTLAFSYDVPGLETFYKELGITEGVVPLVAEITEIGVAIAAFTALRALIAANVALFSAFSILLVASFGDLPGLETKLNKDLASLNLDDKTIDFLGNVVEVAIPAAALAAARLNFSRIGGFAIAASVGFYYDIPKLRTALEEGFDLNPVTANIVAEIAEITLAAAAFAGLQALFAKLLTGGALSLNTTALGINTAAINRLAGATVAGGTGVIASPGGGGTRRSGVSSIIAGVVGSLIFSTAANESINKFFGEGLTGSVAALAADVGVFFLIQKAFSVAFSGGMLTALRSVALATAMTVSMRGGLVAALGSLGVVSSLVGLFKHPLVVAAALLLWPRATVSQAMEDQMLADFVTNNPDSGLVVDENGASVHTIHRCS